MAMKYFYENDIVKQGWASYDQLNKGSARPINVRFCRDCPFFEINGIQPDRDNLRGWCKRLSFEGEGKYTPHYIRVDSNSFCNENHISGADDYEIL